MQAYLGRLTYHVETCANATEALALVRADPTRFALVVADLSLPDLSGNDMALKMLKMNPLLLVLLCSGYPFELATLPAAERGRFATLQKPFLPNMLAASVEELLSRRVA